ncbi:unnamed protein product [Cuscuta epithymum]|uniref:Integrase catalytic domain-containing protein n=1 Tax=Cuscuta epithymum TaxID=186058 RepID=A0AAV0EUB3_9ASTE|nr:unnamed protein product [Cuscuta epithymum]
MESYLREIKNLVDALAAINSPVSDKELLQSILAGLGPDYKSLVTTVSLFPEQFPFHILEPRLLEAEQQLLSERQQQAAIGHQAFAVAAAGGQPPAGYAARGRGGRGRGRGRQGRGRGRGYPQQPYSFQHQAATSFGAQQPAGPQPSHGGSPAASGSGQQQGFGPQVFSQHPASIQGVQSTRPGTSGFSSGEGILGSVPPPVVCQLCFSAGHSALQCPSRYAPPSAPALLTSNNGDSNTALWYPDSGASAHMTPTEGILVNKSIYTGPLLVSVANGSKLPIANIGDVHLNSSNRPLTLKSVFHVPHIKFNLLSIQKLCADNNCVVIFDKNSFFVKDKISGKVLLEAPSHGHLYPVSLRSQPPFALSSLALSGPIWHRRLGHCGTSILRTLQSQHHICSSSSFSHDCISCRLGKSQRLPFMDASHNSTMPLQLIHSDVWQSPVLSNLGFKYYVCFIDDFSRYTWLYPMRTKAEVFLHFKNFKALVENLFNTRIKIFQSDGGGEFVNSNMQQFFDIQGIYFRKSCPDTPQQNGVAERKHRHLLELTRTMLLEASIPSQFWVDAIFTAAYIINRLPSPLLGHSSPYERLFQKSPDYAFMRVFGCSCFPNISASSANKLSARSVHCVFIGYASGYKGYRCLEPKSGRVYVSRHVRFFENIFPFTSLRSSPPESTSSNSTSTVNSDFFLTNTLRPHIPQPRLTPQVPLTSSLPLSYSSSSTHSQNPPTVICSPETPATSPIHTPSALPANDQISPPPSPPSATSAHDQSSHQSCPPSSPPSATSAGSASPPTTSPLIPRFNLHPMQTRAKSGIFKPKSIFTLNTVVSVADPTCFSEAQKHLIWREAMADEFNALISNNTWDLVPFDSSKNVVGSKWIYKTKFNSDGSIERHKARLVAQRFNQQAGVDFSETFSPVVKPTTVRIVLTLAISFGWVMRQLDVKNAFLHGHLTEEVYMRQPRGFVHPQFPHHMCRLRKAIYGLKQAPRAWFHRFSSFLLTHNFVCSKSDNSLFIYRQGQSVMYLLLYVDDIIITGNSSSLVSSFITCIASHFAMKDLGDLHYFLGVQAVRNSKGVFLSQQKYVSDLLLRFHLHTLKSVRTPVATRTSLSLTDGELLADATEYRSMVGALQYLTLTRPDITYAVHLVSQFMHAPRTTHMLAVKRIFRYLQGTIDHGLWLQKSARSLCIFAYSDADWAGCPDTSRSTTGFAIFLGPNLVSWKSKKQPTVSKSSTEAEYRAIAYTVQDTLHIRSVLFELGYSIRDPVHLFCDNISASYLTANPVQHARSKHIQIDYHFVRERVAHGDLLVKYVPTHLQLADIFTKALSSQQFNFLKDNLRVVSPAQLEGV